MKTAKVIKTEIFGAHFQVVARVTCEDGVNILQENYLRGLLDTFYRKKQRFCRLCFQVNGTEILFRIPEVRRCVFPSEENIHEVLTAMNLVAEPKPLPRRRKKTDFQLSRAQRSVEASVQ